MNHNFHVDSTALLGLTNDEQKAVWEIVRGIAEGGVINWSVMEKTDEAKVRPRKPQNLRFQKDFLIQKLYSE